MYPGSDGAVLQRDKSTISRHIKNVSVQGELLEKATVANFATTAAAGKNRSGGPLLLISQAFCDSDQSEQIVFGQIPGLLFQFANQLWFFDVCIEEFLGCDTKIIAKTKKFGERRHSFARGDALNTAFAMAQIQAHPAFRNTFL